ncbi:MAG: transposase domain-containing protein [Opitutales bacterium]|nr:transposase domain-containing protein [Opitutales bacterium]
MGHPKAGRRSAILYTILQNCHLSGHNPQEYLLDVLNRLARADRSDPEFISSLTPKNWKPAASQ